MLTIGRQTLLAVPLVTPNCQAKIQLAARRGSSLPAGASLRLASTTRAGCVLCAAGVWGPAVGVCVLVYIVYLPPVRESGCWLVSRVVVSVLTCCPSRAISPPSMRHTPPIAPLTPARACDGQNTKRGERRMR